MQLNERQQEAVDHNEGALLILAAAGSGKTRVLVNRIGRLLEEGRAQPHEILAVTFTNKAARELKGRLSEIAGPAGSDVWAGTFHGIGARMLRRHSDVLDYPSAFTIYDADDQLRLIKELVAEQNLDDSTFPPDAVRAYIEACKHEAKVPGQGLSRRSDLFGTKAYDIFEGYQKRLRNHGAMDFSDLIVRVLDLFRIDEDLLKRYQKRFRYVFVDEYQDTNHSQYLMVKQLAAGYGNICVVGDDDQSIYGWRGADLRNILEFERDYSGTKIVHLEQNYRSSGNIIKAAQAVIGNNSQRMSKAMWTEAPDGPNVRIYAAADEKDEAQWIISELIGLGDERGDAAVFYRTNAQSRAIEEELVRRRLPYIIVGATRFYERKEIKDLIAYLRFVENPADAIGLARIINVPTRGIGRVSWDKIRAEAARRQTTVWETINDDDADAGLGTAARTKIARFRDMVRSWLDDRSNATVTSLLARIIEDTGYVSWLEGAATDDARARIENIKELLTVSQNFDADFDARELDPEEPDNGPVAAFLEQITLASEIDSYETQEKAVTLMTIHLSKGLEFPHVFVAGMEEGIFPHSRSTDSGDAAIEEERRLCYVAMTRARKQLTLLYAVKRHLYGTTQFNFSSRFLDEIPEQLIEKERHASATPRIVRDDDWAPQYSQLPQYETAKREPSKFEDLDPNAKYKTGMKVVHPMFGVGTVKRCEKSGDDEKLVVQFQRGGMKKLVARYARLEIVGGG
jgi:DNA helicase-2/ATP-dependent DNA helicase PcrA